MEPPKPLTLWGNRENMNIESKLYAHILNTQYYKDIKNNMHTVEQVQHQRSQPA